MGLSPCLLGTQHTWSLGTLFVVVPEPLTHSTGHWWVFDSLPLGVSNQDTITSCRMMLWGEGGSLWLCGNCA